MIPHHRLALAALALGLTTASHAAEGLRDEGSFFLRQHHDDAITWSNWGDAAFARAKRENKPIYLYVGATTSELSRAMQKQSFVNPQIIAALNHDFVSVMVDRDARPDLAALAQSFLQANKQLTGWPANLWITPALKPYDGATYLPPSEEWGKEGILNVVKRLTEEWKNAPESVASKANEAVSNTQAAEYFELGPEFTEANVKPLLEKAATAWLERYDATRGGFGEAPRFAEPELLRFLLRTPGPARDAAVATLQAIDRGALHDPIDGGFFHRTIDAAWEFPSFQKLLGDQARLSEAFLDAAQLTKNPAFTQAAREALDYALTQLASPTGGYIHAVDATAEESMTGYGWTRDEVISALGEKQAAAFIAAYSVKAEGNVSAENDAGGKWKGKNILLRKADAPALTAEQLAAARAKLLPLRQSRAKPLRDQNVIIAENGLFLTALLRAGKELNEPRYEKAAAKLADFLRHQIKEHRVPRLASSDTEGSPASVGSSNPEGSSNTEGSPDDYASLALAFANLGGAAKSEALALLKTQREAFFDAKTGHFFAARADASGFWIRPHSLDPAAGDPSSAEMTTLLANSAAGEDSPEPLLKALTASLNDPNGPPRGDILLTSAVLLSVGAK
ncbi:MAG TPA: DUF255 domain-containing protein [Opitutaceae bacterium]|nr:DUF255 domain-containing protein [Opitutaceae bacterium]